MGISHLAFIRAERLLGALKYLDTDSFFLNFQTTKHINEVFHDLSQTGIMDFSNFETGIHFAIYLINGCSDAVDTFYRPSPLFNTV